MTAAFVKYIRFNTLLYSTLLYSTLLYSTLLYSTENEIDHNDPIYATWYNGLRLSSGVYYYTLEVDGKKLTKRMLMIK